MAKDIFNDEYFSKHRDSSKWSGLKKKGIVNVLNVKNKQKYIKKEEPKPEQIEVKPKPVVKTQPIPKDMDFEVRPTKVKKTKVQRQRTQNYTSTGWKDDYFKSILTGLYGAFVAIIILISNLLNYPISSSNFWIETGRIVLAIFIITIVFGFVYRAASAE
jgi:maltodextrin utilization protein YvdJ